ncbi:hypothetical protein B0H11DRAFT_2277637 [Mycena galericulata]|nr:hypothetical protein B0H11DRAFT_2277637 [Mycena galericulata]
MHKNHQRRGASLPYTLPTLYDPLFTTNTAPLDSQLAQIAESAGVALAIKTRLEKQITETQMQLLRLEREALHATRHYERCQYPLAPIRRVPTEILSRIFVSYAELVHDSTTVADVQGGVWLLGHVCGHWRAIALSTQSLWSNFTVDCSVKARDVGSLADEFLLRSGSHPLHISFTWDLDNEERDGTDHPLVGENPYQDVFDTILARCSQWEVAKFRLPLAGYSDMLIIKGNLPNLRRLDLSLFRQFDEGLPSFHDLETFRVCPRLVDLTLNLQTREESTYIMFPWHQLERYSGRRRYGDVNVLGAAPNLRVCRLDRGTFLSGGDLIGPLVHQMRTLDISSGCLPLEHLELPSLEHLVCFMVQAMLMRCLLRRSNPPLSTLTLKVSSPNNPVFDLTSLVDFMAAVPTVEHLTIEGFQREDGIPEPGMSAIFTHLVYTPEPFALFPSLKHFTMSGVAFDAAFVRMVESRLPRSAFAPATRLESLSVSAVGATNTAHLLRLRQFEVQNGLMLTIGLGNERQGGIHDFD